MPIKIDLHDSTSLIEATPSSSSITDKRLEAMLKEEIVHRIEGDAYLQQQIDEIIAGGACTLLIEEKEDGSIDISLLDKDDHKLSTQTIHLTEKLIKGVTLDSVEGKLVFTHFDDSTLECDISGIFDAIDAERARAESAEAGLSQAITDEASARVSGDEALNTLIEIERNNRLNIDEQLQQNIDGLDSKIDSEVNTLNDTIDDLDTTLRGVIGEESTRAQEAEADLQDQIDNIDSGVAQERERAEAAEQALQDAIDDEEEARISADNALSTLINEETNRAIGIENIISGNLSDEVTARTNADTSLSNAISSESTRAQGVESGLQTQIDNRYTKEQTNTLLDTKQDEITSSNKLLSDLVDDTNQTHKFATSEQLAQIATNTQAISDEASRAQNAESSLSDDIANEESRATTAETALGNRIDALDLAQVGASGSYIKLVSQANGQVNASAQAFDTSLENASDDNAPTSKTVKDYVDSFGGKIDSISINGVNQPIVNKNVDLPAYPTKASLGLDQVDNTSDLDKPISTATQSALDLKANASDVYTIEQVDDIADTKQNVIDASHKLSADLVDDSETTHKFVTSELIQDINDNTSARHTHSNKSILDNISASFTTALKDKLDGIAPNAQVNVLEGVQVNGSDLTITNKKVNVVVPTKTSDITNDSGFITKSVNDLENYSLTSSFDDVAFSGDYNDLSNTPTIGDATLTIQKNGVTIDTFSANATDNKTVNVIVPTKTSDINNDSDFTTNEYVNAELAKKVDKENGKGLSTNDFTDAFETKLTNIEANAQVNILEGVQVNGTDLTITNKKVNVEVPTRVSQLTNDGDGTSGSEFVTNSVLESELDQKVDKVTGYGLSQEDFTTELKEKLEGIEPGGEVNTIVSISVNGTEVEPDANRNVDITIPTKTSDLTNDGDGDANGVFTTKKYVDDLSDTKVDKVQGKQLSTEDFTTAEKTKLSGIATGAQVNVIEDVKVNGTSLPITNKSVDVEVPTKVSDLDNDSGFISSVSWDDIEDRPIIGDATLTISKNGTTINSFNANSTTNTTIDIAVPTSTSDLTNDSDFITNATAQITESQVTGLTTDLANKVDVEAGKGLSTNDFTNALKSKLEGIESGAEVNVQADWTETNSSSDAYIQNKPNLEALLNEKQDVIDSSNKLDADLVDDSTSTNKFVNASILSDINSNTSARHTHNNKSILDATTASFTTAQETKLSGIESGAQVNVIEDIKVNGTSLTPTSKSVDISVPTSTSELTNDGDGISPFATEDYVDTNGGKIDSISVNGVEQTIDEDKNVDITVPTKVSDLTNDSGFISGVAWGDITGTLSNQTDLNNALNNKLDKTSTANKVYATDGSGNQTTITYGTSATQGNIVTRGTNGQITLPETPTNNTDAASKKYVDDSISGVSGDISEVASDLSDHIGDTNNPHSVTKAQVGLGSVVNTGDSDTPTENGTTKFTTGGAYTLQNTLQGNINTVDNKLDVNVHIEGSSDEITYDGDTVTKTSPYKNLKTGTTGSRSEVIQLANATTAGLMSHSDYNQIRDNTSRIEQLEGQTRRLLYTDSTTPTQQEIGDFVDNYLESIGISSPTPEDYMGIAVVVAGTYHIWHYYNDAGIGWRDDGTDTVSQFTNDIAGIIKGKATDGFVYAESDGTGSVYGWDTLKTRVTNVETGMVSNVSYDTTNKKITKTINGVTSDVVSASTLKSDMSLNNVENGAQINTIESISINGTSQTITNKNVDLPAYPTKSSWNYDDSYVKYSASQSLTDTQKSTARTNIGLGNVDNTSDATKKTNFTGSIASGNTGFVTGGDVYSALDNKVAKEEGKGLSTNDFTDALKTKLNGIESGAQVNTIESISVNGGSAITPDANKNVDITIPNPITITTTTGSESISDGTNTINVVTRDTAQTINSIKTIINELDFKAQSSSSDVYKLKASNDYTIELFRNNQWIAGYVTTQGWGFYGDVYSVGSGRNVGKPTNIYNTAYVTNLNDGTNSITVANIANKNEIPTSYIESASASGNTLTLTDASGNDTIFTPTFTEQHVGDVVSVGATANSGIAIGGTSANPTVGIASTHKLPTTSEWSSKANISDIPTTYVESVSVSGNTLTLTDASGDDTLFTPTFTEQHLGDVVSVGATSGSHISIGGTTANPTVGIESGYSIPSTTTQTSWTNKYDKPSGGIPASDLAESYYLASNPNGYTSNEGTITGVSVNGTSVATSGVANITSIPWSIISDKPTIPTVNDATLTITQNNTSIGTFTANASTNVTIDVVTPQVQRFI